MTHLESGSLNFQAEHVPEDLCPLSPERLDGENDERLMEEDWYRVLEVADPLTMVNSVDIPPGVKFEYDDLVTANRNRYEQNYDPEDLHQEYVGGYYSEEIIAIGKKDKSFYRVLNTNAHSLNPNPRL